MTGRQVIHAGICRNERPSCPSPPETIEHILTECRGTAEARERIFPELLTTLAAAQPNHAYLLKPPSLHKLDLTLAQFILDCTSFNLDIMHRININNDQVTNIFRISRDLCFAVHSSRMLALKHLSTK